MIFCRIKENIGASLHDSRTNRDETDGENVTFFFPKGFYTEGPQPSWEGSPAAMSCHIADSDPDGFTVSSFRKTLLGKTVRKECTRQFVEEINKGKAEFEFVDTFRSYGSILFRGYLWFPRRPYWRECEIELYADEIRYFKTEEERE